MTHWAALLDSIWDHLVLLYCQPQGLSTCSSSWQWQRSARSTITSRSELLIAQFLLMLGINIDNFIIPASYSETGLPAEMARTQVSRIVWGWIIQFWFRMLLNESADWSQGEINVRFIRCTILTDCWIIQVRSDMIEHFWTPDIIIHDLVRWKLFALRDFCEKNFSAFFWMCWHLHEK